jgi:starvation-inducible DNA-binding protein
MKIEIGITESNRKEVVMRLEKLLADEFVLCTKTKSAYWNVEGPDFYEKHLLFEGQFALLDTFIDKLAERIRTLGHYTSTTLKQILEITHLTETNSGGNSSLDLIKELLMDHETIIIYCRENIHVFGETYKDLGTADLLTGLMEEHEKMAWFLRSRLPKK